MAEQDGSSQPQPIQIEHPIPRRSTFSLTPLSTNDSSRSEPPSPYDDVSSPSSSRPSFDSGPSHLTPSESRLSNGNGNSHSNGGTPQKTRSILNLTSSTLFGIYSSGYDSNQTESSTPWGTGAQTPLRNGSFDVASARLTAESVKDRARQRRKESLGQLQRPRSLSGNKHKRSGSHFRRMLSLLWRAAILFFLGMAYGEFVTRLHDTEEVAPVQVRGINRRSWPYLIFWGTSAVITGSLLPWMDRRQAQASCEAENVDTPISRDGEKELEVPAKGNTGQASNGLGADWNPIVRTVGAFVGIAFAIVSVNFRISPARIETLTWISSVASHGNRHCKCHSHLPWSIRSYGT